MSRAIASLSLLGGQDRNISSIFPHFHVVSLIFPQFFFIFFPHFGLPGGRLAHPERPWLRHCGWGASPCNIRYTLCIALSISPSLEPTCTWWPLSRIRPIIIKWSPFQQLCYPLTLAFGCWMKPFASDCVLIMTPLIFILPEKPLILSVTGSMGRHHKSVQNWESPLPADGGGHSIFKFKKKINQSNKCFFPPLPFKKNQKHCKTCTTGYGPGSISSLGQLALSNYKTAMGMMGIKQFYCTGPILRVDT